MIVNVARHCGIVIWLGPKSLCQVVTQRGKTRRRAAEHGPRRAAGTLPDNPSEIWLPGLVSQSVLLWDSVRLEIVAGVNGPTGFRLFTRRA